MNARKPWLSTQQLLDGIERADSDEALACFVRRARERPVRVVALGVEGGGGTSGGNGDGDSDGPDERSLQTRDHAMASSRMGYI